MDELFAARVLTQAINKLKSVQTIITDKVFKFKDFLYSGLFQWDVVSGSERILKNLRAVEAAQIASTTGRSTVTCKGTRFSEKRLILASDLADMRKFGEQAAAELLGEKLNRELTDMRAKVDRTREFMAAKALAGQVIDDTGTVLVDYGFTGAQKPVLAGKNLWTDSESNPIKNIRAWKKIILQACGSVDGFFAFTGSSAMDALIENEKVLGLLKNQAGQQIAEKGRVSFLAGVEIEEILGSYIDNANARQDFIPAEYFVLVGVSAQTAGELYAPPIDLDDPNGVGSGKRPEMFFSKSWAEKDPSGMWVKAEARPLPVFYKPEAVVYAKVV